MYSKKQAVLHALAEIEALFYVPDGHNFWRQKELTSFGVKFKNNLRVGRHLRIFEYGNIQLGNRVALGSYTQLANYAMIEIGDDFLSASNLTIYTGTHDPVTLIPEVFPVRIGSRVWCGTHVTILPGVSIGDDVVIGAGSVVIQDIPSNSLVVGVPARVISEIDRSKIGKIWTWADPGFIELTRNSDTK